MEPTSGEMNLEDRIARIIKEAYGDACEDEGRSTEAAHNIVNMLATCEDEDIRAGIGYMQGMRRL